MIWSKARRLEWFAYKRQSDMSLVRRVATICGVLTKSIGSKSGSLILQEELSLCGEEIVSIWQVYLRFFFSVIEGVWKVGVGVQVTKMNMYSSGSLKERMDVRDKRCEIRKSWHNKVWCVVGDFNSIRRKEERKSVILVSGYSREISWFNEFIEKSELMDISIVGRKFTWYKLNGSIKSIMERILVSREWLDVWPNSKQFVLSRLISDHCALVLRISLVDWGPNLSGVWMCGKEIEGF